jgi:hypothetical protein
MLPATVDADHSIAMQENVEVVPDFFGQLHKISDPAL